MVFNLEGFGQEALLLLLRLNIHLEDVHVGTPVNPKDSWWEGNCNLFMSCLGLRQVKKHRVFA